MTPIEFQPFPKIARLSREITVTEKIDGTNAAIGVAPIWGDQEARARKLADPAVVATAVIDDDLYAVYAQSRKRLIRPGKGNDNHGFAGWVVDNAPVLAAVLGPGLHFGEWYGRGIQRGYGTSLEEGAGGKFFALFNTKRWTYEDGHHPLVELSEVPGLTTVPVLAWASTFNMAVVESALRGLEATGSYVTGGEGFDQPEGVVVYHKHSNTLFKRTFENDEAGKGQT